MENQRIEKRRGVGHRLSPSKKTFSSTTPTVRTAQLHNLVNRIDDIVGRASPTLSTGLLNRTTRLQSTQRDAPATLFSKIRTTILNKYHTLRDALRRPHLATADIPLLIAIIVVLLPLGTAMSSTGTIMTHVFQSPFFVLPSQSDRSAKLSTQLKIAQQRVSSTIPPIEQEQDFSKVSYKEIILNRGDTLSDIALRHNITVSTLASFNKIDNARSLQAGRTYRIPDREGLLHVVKAGESLQQITDRYSVDTNTVLDTNDLPDAAIAPGLELFIPGVALSDWELRLLSGELFSYPTSGRLTSGYGYRNDPFTGIRRFHYGVDWGAPTGRAVRAAMEGSVSYIGNQGGGYGKYIILRHPGGFQTLYAHLNGFNVSSGQSIARGEVIGWVGNTGRSTGAHLHFAIIKNGRFRNPFNYLN